MSFDIRSNSYSVFSAAHLSGLFDDVKLPKAVGHPGVAPDQVIDANAATKQQIQSTFKEQFGEYAADPQKFHALMREVYGDSYDVGKA
ncbi:MAG TPA: hypothetical protein VH475_04295, partial [Tepidisphaeraceae bacterium]